MHERGAHGQIPRWGEDLGGAGPIRAPFGGGATLDRSPMAKRQQATRLLPGSGRPLNCSKQDAQGRLCNSFFYIWQSLRACPAVPSGSSEKHGGDRPARGACTASMSSAENDPDVLDPLAMPLGV
jgi:hypothetical protein